MTYFVIIIDNFEIKENLIQREAGTFSLIAYFILIYTEGPAKCTTKKTKLQPWITASRS